MANVVSTQLTDTVLAALDKHVQSIRTSRSAYILTLILKDLHLSENKEDTAVDLIRDALFKPNAIVFSGLGPELRAKFSEPIANRYFTQALSKLGYKKTRGTWHLMHKTSKITSEGQFMLLLQVLKTSDFPAYCAWKARIDPDAGRRLLWEQGIDPEDVPS